MSMMRMAWLGVALAAGGLVWAQGPQVKTEKGALEGTASADGKVVMFRGVPFAAAPVGDLRWRPPMAAAAWTGVREAKAFGAHCVQNAVYADMLFHDTGASEDCLTLNVWAPAGAKAGSLPVMVWILGAGIKGAGLRRGGRTGRRLRGGGLWSCR